MPLSALSFYVESLLLGGKTGCVTLLVGTDIDLVFEMLSQNMMEVRTVWTRKKDSLCF